MSQVLILNEAEVHRLLTMEECIGVMEAALGALARGEAHQPLRSKLFPPGAAGLLGLMPAYLPPYYGLKEVCVFPGNPARGLDSHLGAVLLHSAETGELLAIVNAAAVTAIRTAAVSAVATRLLSREDSTVLAIIGAGVQARSHLEAIPLVRPISEVRIYSRKPVEDRQSCLSTFAGPPGQARLPVLHLDSAERAVRGADIVVTATSSREPVIQHQWLSPGTHINAVGSSIPTARELDTATVASASLFVDRRESTVNESGDYLFAARETPVAIQAEVGDILIGKAAGRKSPEEITLFKSLGLAVEDLAAAAFLFGKAKTLGTGRWVEF